MKSKKRNRRPFKVHFNVMQHALQNAMVNQSAQAADAVGKFVNALPKLVELAEKRDAEKRAEAKRVLFVTSRKRRNELVSLLVNASNADHSNKCPVTGQFRRTPVKVWRLELAEVNNTLRTLKEEGIY